MRCHRMMFVVGLLTCGLGCGRSDPEQPYDVPTLGSYQDYDVPSSGIGMRVQVVSTSAEGFTRRTTAPTQSQHTDTQWLVSDGAELVAAETTYAGNGVVDSTTAWSPASVLLPSDQTPGASTTTVSAVADATLYGGPTSYVATQTVTVDGLEAVTVPAGTFTALKTTAHVTTDKGYDWYVVLWWARGVGRVKLLSYWASNPANATTWELRSWGIAAVP